MRLFFAMDGDTKCSEITLKPNQKMAGDFIVCHTEALYHQLKGEQVLSGDADSNIVLCLGMEINIKKPPVNLVFFTKVPKDISSKRQGDHVIVTASFE